MPIDPGQLDRKIVIEKRTDAVTSMGAKADAWEELTSVWAARYDRKARQSWEDEGPGKVTAFMYTDWRFYYTSETAPVSSDCRINSEGQVFDIMTVRRVGSDILEITSRLRTDSDTTPNTFN